MQTENAVSTEFRRTSLDLFQSIANYRFSGRPTVQFMLISGRSLLLVKSAKAEEGDIPILPQGGIKKDQEFTLMTTLLREARVELGLTESCIDHKHKIVLGEYLNPIPPARQDRYPGMTDKHCFLTALSVRGTDWVRLGKENAESFWVDSPAMLEELIGHGSTGRQKLKFQAIRAAIGVAHKRGALPWSCGSLVVH